MNSAAQQGSAAALPAVVERLFDHSRAGLAPGPVAPEEVYADLGFPRGAGSRPYTAVNMVATVDGKTVVGGPGTTRLIGSDVDHYLMQVIAGQADGVLIGANLLRSDDPPYPQPSPGEQARRAARGLRPSPLWTVVTTAADFPLTLRLCRAGPQHLLVLTTRRTPPERPSARPCWNATCTV